MNVARTEDLVVTLKLTSSEAQALAEILAMVGGDDRTSPRRYTDDICNALESIGYRHTQMGDNENPWIYGEIRFTQDSIKRMKVK